MIKFEPFLKWAGGKYKLAPQIIEHLPNRQFSTYHEPFAGGSGLFAYLLDEYLNGDRTEPIANQIILSDLNADLINVYHQLKVNHESLISVLEELSDEFYLLPSDEGRRNWYLQLREVYNNKLGIYHRDELTRAAYFLTINRTCYRGLYRVNSDGFFNVGFGDYKRPKICNSVLLEHWGSALSGFNVVLNPNSFLDVVNDDILAGNGLVYLDPPYYDTFTGYTSGHDREVFLEQLVERCNQLSDWGNSVLVSNSDCDEVRAAFAGWKITPIQASRAIGAGKEGVKSKASEILITNYQT